jgi:phosphoribosylformimino-5-aminoimidazole carboxamide ribotide isomerase
MRLIPSIDLRGGRCVRLLRGDFDAETRYDADPRQLLRDYQAQGAEWLHIVDLDGARDGLLANRALIGELAAMSEVKLQVGGGVRSAAVIDDLLQAGVARVVVGSAAVDAPADTLSWLQHYGPARVCLGFDVSLDTDGVPRLRTHGWRTATARSLWDAVEQFLPAGLQHVLCTDIARDGALAGPNVALYADAVKRYPQIAWQASGGISQSADLARLAEIGASAAISGKALLEKRIATEELQPYLRVV